MAGSDVILSNGQTSSGFEMKEIEINLDSSNYDNQNNEESESTESNDDYDTR